MRNILLYLLLLSASVPCFGQSAKDEAKMADNLKQFFSKYKPTLILFINSVIFDIPIPLAII